MKLQKAISKITYKMARSLKRGESIYLDKKHRYELYRYTDCKSVVLRDNKKDRELYSVLYNKELKTVEFIKIW